jgi:hypothetical protein
MTIHKFELGQTVFLKPFFARNVPGGEYTVIKRLPERGGQIEYRVKSANEPHERVATEDQLSEAVNPSNGPRFAATRR